jgi:hypothetical protein
VADKESITNIHKWSRSLYGVNAVDKSTVIRLASGTVGSKSGPEELSDARRSGHTLFLGGGCNRNDFGRPYAMRANH